MYHFKASIQHEYGNETIKYKWVGSERLETVSQQKQINQKT